MLRLLLVLVLALAVGGCGGAPPRPPEAAPPAVLRLALPSDIRGWDPAQSNDIPTTKVLGAVFESLLQYHYLKRPLEVVPDLAAALPEVSPDGRTYTFRIRPGVRYHDDPCFRGRARTVRAEDLVLAFQRVADPKVRSGGWWVLEGWVEGLDAWRDTGADYAKPVAGLEAVDELTFRVRLTRPYPQFRYMMTMVAFAPVPAEAVATYGADLVAHAVGTGPFRLERYQRGHRIQLAKNPHYRDVRYPADGPEEARGRGLLVDAGARLPLVDEVLYEIIVEPQPAWLKFLAGHFDVGPIPKDSFSSAVVGGATISPDLAAKGIRLQQRNSQTIWWLGMNMADPLFQGEAGGHLRRAIAHAHDARRFVDLIFSGRGRPHLGILPPDLPGYAPEAAAQGPTRDLRAARQHLEQAGWPGGRGAPRIRYDLRDESSTQRQAGEFLQRELRAIGLDLELVGNTYQAFERKARQGKLQLYLGRWTADYPDAENWTQLLYGPNAPPGTNASAFRDEEYDRLHEETRVMTDSPARAAKLGRMQEIVAREVPWRVSFLETKYVLHHEWVKNLLESDEIYNGHKYLRLDLRRRGAAHR